MIRSALVFLLFPIALMADQPAVSKLLPLHEAVKIVAERFEGRLLAARIDQPEPYEFARGVNIVHELVLLSSQGNVLRARLDGETGRVLDIRGRGLTQARATHTQDNKERSDALPDR